MEKEEGVMVFVYISSSNTPSGVLPLPRVGFVLSRLWKTVSSRRQACSFGQAADDALTVGSMNHQASEALIIRTGGHSI